MKEAPRPIDPESTTRVKKNLPRLSREAYKGLAVAHWVFTIEDRKTGWLDDLFFARFQTIATHACHRYNITAPCICLMPDHIHLLLMGYKEKESDQNLAVRFLRKHVKQFLPPTFEFQRPPYDHVLRKEERMRKEFQHQADYIRENPLRAGLISDEGEEWPYQCAIVPGYPDLNTAHPDFWDLYWRIYYRILEDD